MDGLPPCRTVDELPDFVDALAERLEDLTPDDPRVAEAPCTHRFLVAASAVLREGVLAPADGWATYERVGAFLAAAGERYLVTPVPGPPAGGESARHGDIEIMHGCRDAEGLARLLDAMRGDLARDPDSWESYALGDVLWTLGRVLRAHRRIALAGLPDDRIPMPVLARLLFTMSIYE